MPLHDPDQRIALYQKQMRLYRQLKPYFVRGMHAWMLAKAGTGAGQLLYDVYLNDNELVLAGAVATQYRALKWGNR